MAGCPRPGVVGAALRRPWHFSRPPSRWAAATAERRPRSRGPERRPPRRRRALPPSRTRPSRPPPSPSSWRCTRPGRRSTWTRRRPDRLVSGRLRTWRPGDGSRPALRVVRRDRLPPRVGSGTAVVVPASAVRPGFGVATVEGIDPLRPAGGLPPAGAGPGAAGADHAAGGRRHHAGPGGGRPEPAIRSRPLRPLPPAPVRRRPHRRQPGEHPVRRRRRRSRATTRSRPRPASCPGWRRWASTRCRWPTTTPATSATGALLATVGAVRGPAGSAGFGAGRDLAAAASRPAVLRARNGVRFGFVGFNAIGETPRATPGRPGALSVRMPPRTGPLQPGRPRAT